MWCLDREYTKIKSEIDHYNSEKAALDKDDKENIQWLWERYNDAKLLSLNHTTKELPYKSKAQGHLV